MNVRFTDTTLRDAHQSLLATRLSTEELVKVSSLIDDVGYNSVEMWGGATFDVSVRYLGEDPWERLDRIREQFKKTKIQMLLRGQNLLGYRHYADDVVELFVKKVADHGMDIVRVFDALNDFRNLEKASREIKKHKMHLQVAISYTTSPVHNVEYFAKLAKKAYEELSADSLCIKDMAGLLTPGEAKRLVENIKKNCPLPLQIHAHFTTGLADLTYLAAAEAGAEIVDTAISALAYGTSQPAAESLWVSFNSLGYASKPDLKLLKSISDYFLSVRERHVDHDVSLLTIKPEVLTNQIPGGMYSNMISQLKSQKALNKLEEVLREVPRVREDLGYPPLVTPTSQIVGVQAVLNVIIGERYKVITNETEKYVLGYYGVPPAPINPELKKRIESKGKKTITGRAADYIPPEVSASKEKFKTIAQSDEDLLTLLLLGEVGRKYLVSKYEKDLGIDFSLASDFSDTTIVYPV
ncbi:oxaloacetate decarboxylase [Kosmotoga arenicorallina S304]|uniref:Oxaloacetate decarboxylase n=1 Tax=Kosmotoga arenicorallina S304 TaxID=1453497 RepID=A0A176K383_9BACT|nr:pyruvate carboxylase subunit B [Kosmotoga arenicorallina]OAA31432.1 oxaloacetate decarboxylase [Kosmotoga arenicorallina S304]